MSLNEKFSVEVDVTLNDLAGIIITAVEGGINYWADIITTVQDKNKEFPFGRTIKIIENDGSAVAPGAHLINCSVILCGLQICARKYPRIFVQFIESGECGEYAPDAGVCDSIVQCAIFGEIVYG